MMQLLLLLCFLLSSTIAGLEATFTPNPKDDKDGGGPLPLSQKQRDQLTQLQQAIANSPDPQATLTQVANANDLTVEELQRMLQRNQKDMMQQQPLSPTTTRQSMNSWPQAILRLLTTLLLVVKQLASKHPKAFGTCSTALLLMLYISWTVPKTGLVLSTHSGILSKGHSTFWSPPGPYLQKVLQLESFGSKQVSFHPTIKVEQEIQQLATIKTTACGENGVEWYNNLPRTCKVSQLATAKLTLELEDFMPDRKTDRDDDDDDDDDEVYSAMADLLFEAASDILTSRRFTEFSQDTKFLSRARLALLVIPKAGDWNGYGLQPLKVNHQEESDHMVSVSYVTLQGGVLDGQLTLRVTREDQGNVHVELALAIPRKARMTSRTIATTLLDTLGTSIVTSISTQVRQLQSRRVRSQQFSESANIRAKERQHGKLVKSLQMEEMAADRRRRRRNPNAGRYRPSGQKMPTSTSPGRGQ
jgi:hypothetical protein